MTGPHRTPPSRRRRLRRGFGDDRGTATGWAIAMMITATLVIALVVDAARAMTTKIDALDIAQQAARAGADQLDLAELRTTGLLRLDRVRAETAATAWLTRCDADGTVTASVTTVEVTVTRTRPTLLMRIVGVDTVTVSATAHAEPVTD